VNLFNFFKRFYPSNKYTKIIIDPADVTDTTTTEKTIDTEEHALITRAYIEYLYEYLRRLVLQNKNKYEGNINTFIKNTVINHYVSMTRCDS
jgi:isopentenyldiphosphate isomerase